MSDPDQPDMLPGLRSAVRDGRARAAARRAQADRAVESAASDPVARVLVDVGPAHLDRDFDYLVPDAMAADAVPGARVKVRFAGQDIDGYVVARVADTEHDGRLTPLRRVVSSEPVLHPEILELSAALAERYAGTRSDVLRLAIPPRHAATEARESPVAPDSPAEPAPPTDTGGYPAAGAFLGHLRSGGSPRAVWGTLPGEDWPALVAEAAAATYAGGRGVVICVPDRRDVDRVDEALTRRLGPGHHVTLAADAGPARRYADFLAVSRGARRIVVGTRSAAFAPVRDLGLVVIWDDGDDLYAEPRAPYCHTREVLLTRAQQLGSAALLMGFARSVEADQLVRTGWAREVVAARGTLRDAARVEVVESADRAIGARIPHAVHDAIRQGLTTGPVLVQTPRAGYAPALACEHCRTPARCEACAGPLALRGPTAPPRCRWCGTEAAAWSCPECGRRGLRAPVLGESRTAEELGRMFPGVTVRTSGGERVKARVGLQADLVVATVGAEPVAEGGYSAVVLLDTWLTLARDDLRVAEEALRRWLGAAGLVRSGGRVVAVGDPAQPAIQALVRWDPAGFAAREAAQRADAHLPPAARIATLTGAPGAIDDALTLLDLPPATDVLGPVACGPVDSGPGKGADSDLRVVLRSPRAHGPALSRALRELQRVRSARKLDPVRVQVDPSSL